MSQYRYMADHPQEVLEGGSGRMVGFGDFLNLNKADQEDANNADLIKNGVLMPVPATKKDDE